VAIKNYYIVGNKTLYYGVYNSPPFDPVPSHMKSIRSLKSKSFKICEEKTPTICNNIDDLLSIADVDY